MSIIDVTQKFNRNRKSLIVRGRP